jgi:YD repeat-containing protein
LQVNVDINQPNEIRIISAEFRGMGIDPFGPRHDVGDCPCSYIGRDFAQTRRPISLFSGEKREEVIDLSVNTPAGTLAFTRAYRQSKQNTYQFMGLGWTHNHAISLDDSVTNKLIVRLGNGGEVHFTKDGSNPNTYNGDPGSTSKIVVDPLSTPARYTLTAMDESSYVFDDQKRLRSRAWPSGESWTYNYDGSGRLASVVDNATTWGWGQRQLQFSYVSNPGQFNDGKLWRVGDQTASGLSAAARPGATSICLRRNAQ